MHPQFGTYAWAAATGGKLTRRERAEVFGQVLRMNAAALKGFAALARGHRTPESRLVDLDVITAPDSALAREAEAACAEQPAALIGHAYRTWLFGRALAQFDDITLDPELFYCAALVHDWGMIEITPGRDFTIAGAERALRCGHDAGLAREATMPAADAICLHASPFHTADQQLGAYVSQGALVDVGGLRLWDVSTDNAERVLGRYPRGAGFKRELAGYIKAEAQTNPGGRFGLYQRCGFGLNVRLAPLKDA